MVPRMPEMDLMRAISLNRKDEHQGAHQSEDGVELGKGGVDEGVGLDVVSLGDAHYTVGAYLSLADGGDQADDADSDTDTEEGYVGALAYIQKIYGGKICSVDDLF